MRPLLLVWCAALLGLQASAMNHFDENNPFAFYMFENMKLCKEVFNREILFHKDLRDTRARLADKLKELKDMGREREGERRKEKKI